MYTEVWLADLTRGWPGWWRVPRGVGCWWWWSHWSLCCAVRGCRAATGAVMGRVVLWPLVETVARSTADSTSLTRHSHHTDTQGVHTNPHTPDPARESGSTPSPAPLKFILYRIAVLNQVQFSAAGSADPAGSAEHCRVCRTLQGLQSTAGSAAVLLGLALLVSSPGSPAQPSSVNTAARSARRNIAPKIPKHGGPNRGYIRTEC